MWLGSGECIISQRVLTSVERQTRVCVCAVLVAVIVEAVVAAQGGQSSQPDGVGEEDLCAGIDPHLKKQVRGQRS